MARIVSFVVLVAILLVIGALFFQVMANFLLPMFLALLLVIIFRPLHRSLLARCRGRAKLAAGLTTVVILLIVLVPLALVLVQAVAEGVAMYQRLEVEPIDTQRIAAMARELGERVGISLDGDNLRETISGKFREWIYPVAKGTTQFFGNFLLGLIVMVVSLYYFLADGPEMIATLTRLSPLDVRYTEQLVERFDNVTRAVVLATLLSALVQGVLAGLGLWVAGFSSVFLWMVAAMLLSMVPFIGPPAVWVPAVLWLYLQEGRTGPAIGLAIYGAIIMCTVDNIIKPAVLHGRSNVHPLLALLSVLGGVQAMGPIGIFVGPMAVAMLQTLLNIMHGEWEAMRVKDAARADVP
jgi:predicted PurR-regulated permease PerM